MRCSKFQRVVAVAALAALLAGGCAAPAQAARGSVISGAARFGPPSPSGSTLEGVARKASETGRKIALSLIALGFAIAAIVLAFKRDFKEAVAVFAIGVVAVLFAQESGIKLVENLVASLVGS